MHNVKHYNISNIIISCYIIYFQWYNLKNIHTFKVIKLLKY